MNRNILNRSMFAAGDEVKTLPLYDKHASGKSQVVYDRGVDPEFDSFLDRYGIDAETYQSIHADAGNFLIYDPGLKQSTPLLDIMAGRGVLKGLGSILTKKGTQGTGMYVGERLPGGIAGPNRPLTEITENVTKLTPVGKSTAIGTSVLPLAASTPLPDDEEETGPNLVAKNQDEVQTEIDELEAKNKKDLENKKKKSNKTKIEKEIKGIEDVISMIKGFDTKKSEAYQQEKTRRTGRNANIFMEEMASALAATNNMGDGIAIGAANAAKKVGEAETDEELARLEARKKEAELSKDEKLKDTTILDVARDYSLKTGEVQGSNIMITEVSELRNLLRNNDVTGLQGWMSRLVGKGQGFVGADLNLRDAQAASNIGKFLEARMVQALLDEKGKTISDADRKLIQNLLGDLDSPTSNRATMLDKLELIETTLLKTKRESQSMLDFYKEKYGDKIPELSIFDSEEEISDVFKKDDNEVSIADQEDLIQ